MRSSVAAGVVLIGYQNQARAGRGWFWARGLAEGAQYCENCDVRGEDSEADRGDNGEAEDDGHQERDHGLKVLFRKSARAKSCLERLLPHLSSCEGPLP